MNGVRVTALLTSHNRCDVTLRSARSFFGQTVPPSVTLDAVLVDDASSDGTAQEIRRLLPQTRVVQGSGDLYWAGGMALAEQVAASVDPDYFLWLNDDVTLDEDAVVRLLATEESFGHGRCIIVGAMRDPNTSEVTYSGVRRLGIHPLRVATVEPQVYPQIVDMFHGNLVLVSRRASCAVGPIDGNFSHAQADFDYALRARRVGLINVLAPGTFGSCVHDGSPAPWLELGVPATGRLRILFGRKGLPPRSAARYLRRHGGPLWPVFWVAPYVKMIVSLVRSMLSVGKTQS